MTSEFGVAELKRRFSELVDQVASRGDRIVVRRRGRAVAVLVSTGCLSGPEPEVHPGNGLLAAIGAWAELRDPEGFLDEVTRCRETATDREPESLR